MNSNVSVVGLGKLGLCYAALMADSGHTTIGVDVAQSVVDSINTGKSPVIEPGLPDLIAKHGGKNLLATTAHARAIEETDCTFILVATPSNPDGSFSNQYVESAVRGLAGELGRSKKSYHNFVLGSTVTPGAATGVVIPLIEKLSGRRLNEGFGLSYDPEFVALGDVLKGFREPDLIMIGQSSEEAGDRTLEVHRTICRNNPPVVRTTLVSAEIAKVSLNAYMTLKISFANMLANLCERIPSADLDAITGAIGLDRRIGPKFLRGGLAYGGPCFPRDTKALIALANREGYDAGLIRAVEEVNLFQNRHLAEMVSAAAARVTKPRVAVLGVSFKPGTPVIVESAAINLVEALLAKGVEVTLYDPLALDNARALLKDRVRYARDAVECLAAADVCVIANPEKGYKTAVESLQPDTRLTVIDCWRLLDPKLLAPEVDYVAWGYHNPRLFEPKMSLAAHGSEAGVQENSMSTDGEAGATRVNVMGVGVNAVNMQTALSRINGWIARREPNYVLTVPAHCLVDCKYDENLRKIYNRAGMVTPDGMPVAWVLKRLGYRDVDRVYGPDLMLAVCENGVAKGYRHYLYGGTPVTVSKLARRLRERFPGIQIVGEHAPPFPYTAEDDSGVTKKINQAQPDIVWCGLGAAKEEFWTSDHCGRLVAPVLIGVGAAFDFHSGTKAQAPRWIQRAGLEWLFRTATEPMRLGPRYLKSNPLFIWHVMMQMLGKQQASI
jgi:UDPglucose 6-dehydrogenase